MSHSTETGRNTVIDVRGVRKSFRRGETTTQILAGIELQVSAGECVFLVGPSGSGKSTLLSILGCILSPDAGVVRLLDTPVDQLSPRQLGIFRRDHLGFVFQRFHLLAGLTALENVCVPQTLQGKTTIDAHRKALELLDAVGLADHATADVRRLSAGQCQRVALARALINNPDLILADEPTAALDEAAGLQVMELIRGLALTYQKTVLVVTHDVRIYPFADRVLTLAHGQLNEASRSNHAMEVSL